MMKKIPFLFLLLCSAIVFSQTFHISLSNPQPRIGEKFSILIDQDFIGKELVFKNLNKLGLTESQIRAMPVNELLKDENVSTLSEDSRYLKIEQALEKKGRYEYGPLEITVNGKKYLSNKIIFQVIDALPLIAEGLWVRVVPEKDSILFIIQEQRIPNQSKVDTVSENQMRFYQASEYNNYARLKYSLDLKGLRFITSSSFAEQVNMRNEFDQSCTHIVTIYTYSIIDKSYKPLIISREDFDNLPASAKFTEYRYQ